MGPFRVAGEEDAAFLTTNYHLESLSGEIVSRTVLGGAGSSGLDFEDIEEHVRRACGELTGVTARFANVQPGQTTVRPTGDMKKRGISKVL